MYKVLYEGSDFESARVFQELDESGLPESSVIQIVESESDLKQLPGPVLVSLYNQARPGEKINKFENKQIAASRVMPLLESLARTSESSDRSIPKKKSPKKKKRSGPTRRDALLNMLRRDQGVTIDEIREEFGWLPHTARAALTGIRKSETVKSEKVEGRGRIYKVE